MLQKRTAGQSDSGSAILHDVECRRLPPSVAWSNLRSTIRPQKPWFESIALDRCSSEAHGVRPLRSTDAGPEVKHPPWTFDRCRVVSYQGFGHVTLDVRPSRFCPSNTSALPVGNDSCGHAFPRSIITRVYVRPSRGIEGGHQTKVAHRPSLRPTACSTAGQFQRSQNMNLWCSFQSLFAMLVRARQCRLFTVVLGPNCWHKVLKSEVQFDVSPTCVCFRICCCPSFERGRFGSASRRVAGCPSIWSSGRPCRGASHVTAVKQIMRTKTLVTERHSAVLTPEFMQWSQVVNSGLPTKKLVTWCKKIPVGELISKWLVTALAALGFLAGPR